MQAELQIPAEFLCAKTKELMDSPVRIDACGHVVDAFAVLDKIRDCGGKKKCPCCNKRYEHSYPVNELKEKIAAFKETNKGQITLLFDAYKAKKDLELQANSNVTKELELEVNKFLMSRGMSTIR